MYMIHETETQSVIEATRMQNEINNAHVEASHNVKLGTSLADKAIKLIESGNVEKTLFSPRLGFGLADHKTTSLVLNSELKSRGIDAVAKVDMVPTGTFDDPSYKDVLRIKKIHGKKIV